MKIIIPLFTLLMMPSVASAYNLIFTEIQIRGESPDESYITIFNHGSINLDISGFKLRKRSSTGKEYSIRVFPQGSIIQSKEYFTWSNSKNDYHLDINADIWSTAGISNNNSIAILSPEGKIIDSLAWGNGENQFLKGSPLPSNPEKNQIIKRIFLNSEYRDTGDNSVDFRFDPEITINIPESNFVLKRQEKIRRDPHPITSGAGIALISALSILMLKKSLN